MYERHIIGREGAAFATPKGDIETITELGNPTRVQLAVTFNCLKNQTSRLELLTWKFQSPFHSAWHWADLKVVVLVLAQL